MTTVFLCHSLADQSYAAALADFLERGADVRVFVEEGLIGSGEDLVTKAREGRTADAIILLLSPDSVNRKWPRAEWEEAFLTGPAQDGVRIAYLERAACDFPAVLKREQYYTDRRAIKRWIRTGERQPQRPLTAELEELACTMADRPGTATSPHAEAFVDHCAADFDAVVWLRCGDRSLAQLTGEFGAALGLRLDGEPISNAERLREFCKGRRLLVVLEDASEFHTETLVCGGETSTLLTEAPVREYRPTELAAIQQAFAEAQRSNWRVSCDLARRGFRMAQEQSRNAEAFELMKSLFQAAKARNDGRILAETAREQIWILEHWGRITEANNLRQYLPGEPDSQLTLF